MKLIEKNDEGIYFLTKNHLSTPEKWKSLIIKDFQREVIKMSSESIERDHKDLRDISTITMAIEADKLPLFKTMLKEFREAVIGQVDEMATPNAVYQLNLQMIPLTQSSDKK